MRTALAPVNGEPLRRKAAVPKPRRRPAVEVDVISALPWEVRNTLLTHLTPKEVLRSQRVAAAWRDAARQPELWALIRRFVPFTQLLREEEKLVERRSKGKLFRCVHVGTGEKVLLRKICLGVINAGKDDGVPTSSFRECSALSELQHPNVARLHNINVMNQELSICTEYLPTSFAEWLPHLPKRVDLRLPKLRACFRQLLEGLNYVHHQGIVHRNLKPDNIFLDHDGTVKIGDFASSRQWQYPLQAYSPEDPKERDRSGRESKRLYYRAPELLLRLPRYGPEVDAWAIGCLLVEAAVGAPLFPSESEIEHLCKCFRLVGTPNAEEWPEILGARCWNPRFPCYKPFDWDALLAASRDWQAGNQKAAVARVEPLASGCQGPVATTLWSAAKVLGPLGTELAWSLLLVPPSKRRSAGQAVAHAFFGDAPAARPDAVESPVRPAPRSRMSAVSAELGSPEELGRRQQQGKPAPVDLTDVDEESDLDLASLRIRSPLFRRQPQQVIADCVCQCQRHLPNVAHAPSCTIWSVLDKMRAKETVLTPFPLENRAQAVDWMVDLAKAFSLNSWSVHIAVGLLDKYSALTRAQGASRPDLAVTAVSCVKLADVFNEVSKEYYKQDNAKEYADMKDEILPRFAPDNIAFTAQDIVTMEKQVISAVGFDLHIPTTFWFANAYLVIAGLDNEPCAPICAFLCDLVLLDDELLRYRGSLVAQACLVMSVFFSMQAVPASQLEAACDASLAAWRAAAPPPVEWAGKTDATSVWRRLVEVVCEERRRWRHTLGLEAVEARHPASLRITYPEAWPGFLLKYLT